MRVGGYILQRKQIDLGIPQGVVLSITFFLVAINEILGELGNGVGRSLFTDDLAVYITTRSQRVTSRVLQRMTNKSVLLPQQNSKHEI